MRQPRMFASFAHTTPKNAFSSQLHGAACLRTCFIRFSRVYFDSLLLGLRKYKPFGLYEGVVSVPVNEAVELLGRLPSDIQLAQWKRLPPPRHRLQSTASLQQPQTPGATTTRPPRTATDDGGGISD